LNRNPYNFGKDKKQPLKLASTSTNIGRPSTQSGKKEPKADGEAKSG